MAGADAAGRGKDDPAQVAKQGFEALMGGKDKVLASSVKTKVQGIAKKVLPDKVKAAAHRRMAEPRVRGLAARGCGQAVDKADRMAHLELVVLGSGGPFVTARRTSASYVVLLGGRPLLLLDCGGGAFARLGQAGVDPAE
ncbi:MAG: hypothetical protein ACR2JG_02440 [Geodermatophilaceae bacterium]